MSNKAGAPNDGALVVVGAGTEASAVGVPETIEQ